MVQYWEPGTSYGYGDVVEYEGHRYRIIQAHTSQTDWAPPVTPALWGRMQDGDHGQEQQHHCPQQSQQPQQQPYQQSPPQYQPPEKPHNNEQKTDSDNDKKNWLGLDKDDAKKLGLGAGLLGGAAVLAGGLFAYKEHEKNKEEDKNEAWAYQNWIRDAESRTQDFRQNGPRGPATWVLNHGKNIPQGAIAVGPEHSWTLYIARAFHEGSIQVGKASDVFKKGAVIGYAHDEIHVDTYEILLGDMNGLRWVSAHGRLNVSALGYRPVEGGRDRDGTPLYIAKAPYKDAVHPGKASEKLNGAFIPYDGDEKEVKDYQVLCYN